MYQRQKTFRMTLSGNEMKALQIAADTRNVSPDVLFERLMLVLINDGLIDAVLDDSNDRRSGLAVIAR